MTGRRFDLKAPVAGARLAEAIGARWYGPERTVTGVSALSDAGADALTFAVSLEAIAAQDVVVIATRPLGAAGIIADNPRLAFIRALVRLTTDPGFETDTRPPVLAPDATVGKGTVLGRGVVVGAGSRIGHNAVIADGVRIGAGCVVKSGAVIGEGGFGFERDEAGDPLRFPHLGGVIIGQGVEVGSRSTVCRGTLGDTVIGDHVKIDDSAHVAHNCRIGRGALIHAGAVLSGGVEVGAHAWIGPNAAVIQYVRIGERAQVGLGAVVIGDVEDGVTVVGNPARVLRREQA